MSRVPDALHVACSFAECTCEQVRHIEHRRIHSQVVTNRPTDGVDDPERVERARHRERNRDRIDRDGHDKSVAAISGETRRARSGPRMINGPTPQL